MFEEGSSADDAPLYGEEVSTPALSAVNFTTDTPLLPAAQHTMGGLQKHKLRLYVLLACVLFFVVTTITIVFFVYQPEGDPAPLPVQEQLQLTFLEHTEMTCNDGSTPAYYFRSAAAEPVEPLDAQRWVIYLPGGMSCWDNTTCAERAETKPDYMTSTGHPENITGVGVVSRSEENPYYQYNTVEALYCSSDMWIGQASVDVNPDLGYAFQGYGIVMDILQDLVDKHGLLDAETVVLAASSVGSEGLFQMQDSLKSYFLDTLQVEKVFFLHDNGWYFKDANHTVEGQGASEVDRMGQLETWTPVVNDQCASAYPGSEWECFNTADVLVGEGFLNSTADRTMISQNQYDLVLLNKYGLPLLLEDWSEDDYVYADEWAAKSIELLQSSHSTVSYLSAACRIHDVAFSSSWHEQVVEGAEGSYASLSEAFVENVREDHEPFRFEDDCGEPYCNPTCAQVG
jgi:hypothetical protein